MLQQITIIIIIIIIIVGIVAVPFLPTVYTVHHRTEINRQEPQWPFCNHKVRSHQQFWTGQIAGPTTHIAKPSWPPLLCVS